MNFSADQAIYLQIADLVCENILRRVWNEGDKAPSVRELAVELQVNPNTVMRTYTYLQEKGIIEIKRGIGFYIPAGSCEKTLQLMKDDFLINDLPEVKRKMELLGITINEVATHLQSIKIGTGS